MTPSKSDFRTLRTVYNCTPMFWILCSAPRANDGREAATAAPAEASRKARRFITKGSSTSGFCKTASEYTPRFPGNKKFSRASARLWMQDSRGTKTVFCTTAAEKRRRMEKCAARRRVIGFLELEAQTELHAARQVRSAGMQEARRGDAAGVSGGAADGRAVH